MRKNIPGHRFSQGKVVPKACDLLCGCKVAVAVQQAAFTRAVVAVTSRQAPGCTQVTASSAWWQQQIPQQVASAAGFWVAFLEASPLVRPGLLVLPVSF